MRVALPIAALCALATPALGGALHAQEANQPVVLDSVVAVVNNHAILLSEVDRDMRFSVLEPQESANQKPDRKSALDRLISRELIEEQMTPEEAKQAQPTAKDIRDRLSALRGDLPACLPYHCSTDAGWAAFLAASGITETEAEAYLRSRLSLLSFIENRFRQGIRISQDEIETYYREKLTPEYPSSQPAPPLESVEQRISEILLQDQVTQLFGAWLDNLRKQGDVEILDPALVPADQRSPSGGNS